MCVQGLYGRQLCMRHPENTSFHLVTSCAEQTGQNGCFEENAYLELCSDGATGFNDSAFILYIRQ